MMDEPLLRGQHNRELGILITGIKLCPSKEGKGWKGKVLGCAGSKSPTQIPTLWRRLPEEGVLIPGLTWALAPLQRGIFGIKWKFQQVLHGRSRSFTPHTGIPSRRSPAMTGAGQSGQRWHQGVKGSRNGREFSPHSQDN